MTEPHSSSEEFLLIRDNTDEKVLLGVMEKELWANN